MKITTLMENTASAECYTAEHGLSIFIETKNHVILFDSGASGAFADNAEKLGVDLGKVEMAVLSHGHYDHGGGLLRFMEKNKTAPIYMSACAFEPHLKNGGAEDIGALSKGNPGWRKASPCTTATTGNLSVPSTPAACW